MKRMSGTEKEEKYNKQASSNTWVTHSVKESRIRYILER
jgi:hypothetical protein